MKITFHLMERGEGKTTAALKELNKSNDNWLVVQNQMLCKHLLNISKNKNILFDLFKIHGIHPNKLIVDEWWLKQIASDFFTGSMLPICKEIIIYGTTNNNNLLKFMFEYERQDQMIRLRHQMMDLEQRQSLLNLERSKLMQEYESFMKQ